MGAVGGYNPGRVPKPEEEAAAGRCRPEKSAAELGAGSPPPTWGTCTGAVAMATPGPSWKWMVCTLITVLILGVTVPVLANDVASCNNPSATGTSGSTQDLGAEAREDTKDLGAEAREDTQDFGAEAREDTRDNDSSGSRIINGSDCKRGAEPWQGALLLKPNQLYCGAVLVNPQWLLTAAHCRKHLYRIRLGHHSLSPVFESGQQLFRGIKSIPHPGYSHPGHSNDLMLIKLNRRIHETQDVKPINISSHCPTSGTNCLVSGWGTTSSPHVNFPKVLQCLNITVLSHDKCKDAYPGQIDATMFCAGDEAGRDSCQGDSGGPVVCHGTLQGLVSWGDFPCAQPNKPGVYTNLCRFTKWIHDTIQSNS